MAYLIATFFYILFSLFAYIINIGSFSFLEWLILMLVLTLYQFVLVKNQKYLWVFDSCLALLITLIFHGDYNMNIIVYFFCIYFILFESYSFTYLYHHNF